MKAISYRLATQADVPRLREIFNAQYVRQKSEDYFRWQYFDSAWPTVVMCAVENGVVEGVFGLQRRELGGGIPVGQAIDLLITSRMRGRGVFAELGRRAAACFPEVQLLCVLANLHGRNACVKSLGWRETGKIDSLELTTLREPPAKTEDLRYINASDQPAGFAWTDEVRAWRFGRHPEYRYETVLLGADASARVKLFEDPVTQRRYGDIVEFQCEGKKEAALLAELFVRAARRLLGLGVEGVTTWALPHTTLFHVLGTLGFKSRPQERYFCVRSLQPELRPLEEISKWHLVQADAEIF
jgi:hypothetical protein